MNIPEGYRDQRHGAFMYLLIDFGSTVRSYQEQIDDGNEVYVEIDRG